MNKFHGRHRQGADDYLLTGKLYCGICKSPMTGVSGTSKTGASHYYYICQKRRVSHTCTKENVRRDWIEEVVARSIRDYCLQDDIIEIIADKTLEYNRGNSKTARSASCAMSWPMCRSVSRTS